MSCWKYDGRPHSIHNAFRTVALRKRRSTAGDTDMRVFAAAIVAGSLALATVAATVASTVALAQSTSTPAPSGSTAAAPPAAAASATPATAAAPAPGGKKLACQTASETMKGQARKDQMQICMMQARLDCLKQAIDQNIVGPQRADFVKSCAG
jgi:hypothetical protein